MAMGGGGGKVGEGSCSSFEMEMAFQLSLKHSFFPASVMPDFLLSLHLAIRYISPGTYLKCRCGTWPFLFLRLGLLVVMSGLFRHKFQLLLVQISRSSKS